MLKKGKIILNLVVAAGILLAGSIGDAAPAITLEKAKSMAREQGMQMRTVELSLSQAEVSLALLRSQYGLGSYYTAADLKTDMEQLETIIDEGVNAIKLLEESIGEWNKEIKELEPDDPAATELLNNIDQAYRDIAVYRQQVDELRPAFASMVPRYYEQKSREDQASSQLRPVEAGLESAQDALITQPKLIDYNVEQIYLTMLAVAEQRIHQEQVEQNMEKGLQREIFMLELGRSTPLSLALAEQRLGQVQEASISLEKREAELQRTFLHMLGLPVDFDFYLAEVNLSIPNEALADEKGSPDLTTTLTYERALETLEKKRKDLDDTSISERNNYRAAELAVDEAELNLQNTLSSLTNNYLRRAESLDLAVEALRNAELSLQNAGKGLVSARLQFELGMITALDLEQPELSFGEADLKLLAAHQDYHLALQAYHLAQEGIDPDTVSSR